MKAALILIITLASQAVQAQSAQSAMPDGRASAHLIFDRASNSLVLIDGYQIHLDSTRSDVWRWDGRRWTNIVAFGPGSRSLTAAALNSHTGEIMMFAGIGSKNYDSKKSDAWTLQGATWKPIDINDIGTRDHHEMVYMDHLKAFLLYGGTNESRHYDSLTWLFDGKTFSSLDIPGPGMRYHFAMAYDKQRRKVVLYGGGEEPQRSDLWEFDGSQWLKINHDKSPGKRLWHNMIYDDARKMVIVHGSDSKGETWGWDGKSWIKIAEAGPPYGSLALGYDPSRNIIVAYGGSGEDRTLVSELWELDGRQWKKISDNGVWQWQGKGFVKIR